MRQAENHAGNQVGAARTAEGGPATPCPFDVLWEKEAATLTIKINKPEVEALINQRLESGVFEDAEDVILQALQSSPAMPPQAGEPPEKDIEELFAPLRGLNLDFSRNPSTGRTVEL